MFDQSSGLCTESVHPAPPDPVEEYLVCLIQEKGNTAFYNQDYESAIRLYTHGLYHDPDHVLLLASRSTVYNRVHKSAQALEDAIKSIAFDPLCIQGYFQQATSLQETGHLEAALSAVETGFAQTGSTLLETLQKTLETELSTLFLDHPERDQFDALLQWLANGGGVFPKLRLIYYGLDNRGVRSTAYIPVRLK